MLTVEELAAFDRPVPRYTSYPTVPVWGPLPPERTTAALQAIKGPAQLYVHVPFCREQCSFCACNQVVAGRRDAGDRFLDALELQLERQPRVEVGRVHLGGGTPTWLDVPQLRRLWLALSSHFPPVPGAELSVEADPEVTTQEQIRALTGWGFRRLSLGVQSFDLKVLTAVNRPQLGDRVEELLRFARERGWRGLNVDIMYGLPHQSLESFEATLERVIELRPDRLAVFGYAHVPWLRRHQRAIDEAVLPDREVRSACVLAAQRELVGAGYAAIGFDHFALPTDELAQGPRTRNFMGYSVRGGDMIGLGPSAISDVAGVMWQDELGLGAWMRKLRAGEPLAVRGWVRDREDDLREAVIHGLMCDLVVDVEAVEAFWGIDFGEHFAAELDELHPLVDEGLVDVGFAHLRVTERGRPLARLVARAFDARRSPARHSQTV
ncbi:MAG TPA: oxygen-independent coproporphyrinogen III oxidase [Myxococcota bacterium]|nr:oxygen-independent coproporphyrinogen III oxidase [Myxococcota bacterium]